MAQAAEAQSIEPLIVALLEWVGAAGRPYPEVMEAWRTSCPRLPVWEEANDRGFVVRTAEPACGGRVVLTERGKARLAKTATP